MKRFLSVMVVLVVVSFVISEMCFAQLINYNRRKNVQSGDANTPASQPAVAVPAQREEPKIMESTTEAVPSGEMAMNAAGAFKVTNRIEEIYDIDKDGSLQPAEVNAFLTDVVSAVERKGSFSVSSDILKQFDKNDDGTINKAEVKVIAARIS